MVSIRVATAICCRMSARVCINSRCALSFLASPWRGSREAGSTRFFRGVCLLRPTAGGLDSPRRGSVSAA
eukprot:383543-Alexandrium_andersonii.AAC.1